MKILTILWEMLIVTIARAKSEEVWEKYEAPASEPWCFFIRESCEIKREEYYFKKLLAYETLSAATVETLYTLSRVQLSH